MRASLCRYVVVALLTQIVPLADALASPPSGPGSQIYHSGQGSDGAPVKALVQGDVPLLGNAAACVNCHRPSGLGTSEAGVRPLPITGAALFTPRLAGRPRPAYTAESLAAAITSGVAADGAPLSRTMPRYELEASDLQALTHYLGSLGVEPAPGVSENEIVIATVVAEDAPAAEREAVVRVMTKYVEIKNGGSRQEARRSAAAKRHEYGERDARAYKHWRLVIWRLAGPVSGWTRQLQDQYNRTPAFALVSGTTGHDWNIVHQFCETERLPCLLPLSDAPDRAEQDFYSIYYTEGVRLEARIAVSHFMRTSDKSRPRALLVRRSDQRSDAAFDAFRDAWSQQRGQDPVERIVAPEERLDTAFWQAAVAASTPDIVVAWLPVEDLSDLVSRQARGRLKGLPVYTMEAFTDWSRAPAGPQPQADILHVYPYRLKPGTGIQFPREQVWLQSNGLGDLDTRIAGKVLFACHVLGEELSGIRSNFSRDYLMEGLEHMLDGTNMTTLYPRTTMGPGQRYLSRGAYVVSPATVRAGGMDALWVEM